MNVDMTQGLLAAVAAAAPSAPAGPEQAGGAGSSGGEGLSFRELLLQRQGRAVRGGEEAPICGETPRPEELQQALAAALLMQLTGPVQVYADAAPAGPVPEAVAGLDQALPGADWGGRTALFTAQPAPEAGQPPQIRREAGAESLQSAPGTPAQAEVQEQPVQTVQAPERTAEPVLQERPPEARPAEQAPEEPGRAQARQDAAQGEAPLFPELEHIPVKVGQAPVLDTRQPELEQRLAGQLAQAVRSGEERVVIRLAPERLGTVVVELTRAEDGALRVVLHASTDKAADLLGEHAAGLGSLLQADRQTPVQVEVQRQQEQQQTQRQGYQDPGDGGRGGRQQGGQEERRQDSGRDFLQRLRLGLIPADGQGLAATEGV